MLLKIIESLEARFLSSVSVFHKLNKDNDDKK